MATIGGVSIATPYVNRKSPTPLWPRYEYAADITQLVLTNLAARGLTHNTLTDMMDPAIKPMIPTVVRAFKAPRFCTRPTAAQIRDKCEAESAPSIFKQTCAVG